jgi:hypothetical protein
MGEHQFRAGDPVEVKTAAEILATLDEQGRLEGLPFMPEMVLYCGRRFEVASRAQKVCDTSHMTGSRRVPRTVLLDAPRCNGSSHGGCQAECRFFWKEDWLRAPSTPATAPSPAPDEAEARRTLLALAERNTQRPAEGNGGVVWSCQATELHGASQQVKALDPRSYIRELVSGNVGLGRFLRVTARAAVEEPLGKLGLLPEAAIAGTRDKTTPPEPGLGLKSGDWVEVKPKHEIAKTLNLKGRHRGLWFDREMFPYCGNGRRYQVRRRVDRIIDERSGKMIELKNECIALEGVVCSGDYVPGRFFCPRGYFPYWRECWLTRADAPAGEAKHFRPAVDEEP